jgi:hypothetical protein
LLSFSSFYRLAASYSFSTIFRLRALCSRLRCTVRRSTSYSLERSFLGRVTEDFVVDRSLM